MSDYAMNPATAALPLLGHAHELWFRPLPFVQSLRSCGDIATIRIGTLDAFVVNHPALIRRMLVQDVEMFDKGAHFDKMVPFTGNGLFNSHGEFHARQRRLLRPAFRRGRIARYVPMMRDLAEARIRSWTPDGEVDLTEEWRSLALAIVSKALCSTDLGDAAVREFDRSLPIVLDGIGKRVLDPTGLLEKLPLPANRRFDRAVAALHRMIDDIIDAYRRGGVDHGDLLSLMLHAQDGATHESMTDAQVHDEVMSILAAGAETTADTLTWACWSIAGRPRVQNRIRAEVEAVAGDRALEAEDLAQLDYTRRVLTETLRLYPTTWILTRRPRTGIVLGGHPIPAGAMVLFSIYALHRDPALYPEPEVFDPDRWTPERAKDIAPGAYLPFGAGTRGCAGEPFAWAEMLVVLATLVRRRRIRSAHDAPLWPRAKALLMPPRYSIIARPHPAGQVIR
ncbi:cytochrome P450 [Nocardia colli]|uniref:Cytochrome P450 n=1 Tax=Nocardia colli TaxID=2545717 RepID=A0A5N0DYJ3_9NOCA|nr:cytochrome P450 [Nocardia colli]KAA8880611.1 cytochrome P450 [Nocardia colli]